MVYLSCNDIKKHLKNIEKRGKERN